MTNLHGDSNAIEREDPHRLFLQKTKGGIDGRWMQA